MGTGGQRFEVCSAECPSGQQDLKEPEMEWFRRNLPIFWEFWKKQDSFKKKIEQLLINHGEGAANLSNQMILRHPLTMIPL